MRLEFEGKQHIYGHHLTVPISPLIPDYDQSIAGADGESDDENLIIHGDNLYALKSLLPKYAGRVKCIYIDPPYNTGNEGLKYNDRVNSPMHRSWFQKEVGKDDLQRHDKWLCIMWPRLHLLRELLRDDGVIFISIDDNEHHHLHMLMDEIFEEENYCGTFVWERKKKPSFLDQNMGTVTEYVVAYARNRPLSPAFVAGSVEEGKKFPFNNASNPVGILNFPPGSVRFSIGDQVVDAQDMSTPNIITELLDDVEILNGTNANGLRLKGAWRYSQSTLDDFVSNGDEITISKIPFRPNRINRAGQAKKTVNLLSHRTNNVPTNEDATEELRAIFHDREDDVFDYPKPTGLPAYLIRAVSSGNEIILDSFAGSGTTAHAVLSVNKEDGEKRRFILVECEDYADSITAERVRRVIRGVPAAKDMALKEGLGGSFTYCTLGDPLNVSKMLSGESLPSYRDMAVFMYYTATGRAIDPASVDISGARPFYREREREFWLFYRPDIEWLKGSDSTFTESLAERVAQPGSKTVVFAPHKYMPQRHLSEMGITFCQLPFAEPV